MSVTTTLQQFKDRALDAADYEVGFINDTRLTEWVNAEIRDAHDLLIRYFRDYGVKRTTINLVSGTESYTLPTDFYKIRKVFAVDGASRVPLRPFSMEEYGRDYGLEPPTSVQASHLRYRVIGTSGGTIYFSPMPKSGQIDVWYVLDILQDLSGPSDAMTFPVAAAREYVIQGVAARCRIKEEKDPSAHWTAQGRAAKMIELGSANIDLGEPPRVRDVRTVDRFDEEGW